MDIKKILARGIGVPGQPLLESNDRRGLAADEAWSCGGSRHSVTPDEPEQAGENLARPRRLARERPAGAWTGRCGGFLRTDDDTGVPLREHEIPTTDLGTGRTPHAERDKLVAHEMYRISAQRRFAPNHDIRDDPFATVAVKEGRPDVLEAACLFDRLKMIPPPCRPLKQALHFFQLFRIHLLPSLGNVGVQHAERMILAHASGRVNPTRALDSTYDTV